MKECIACLHEKPLTDFYKNSNNLDGRLGRCKECHKNNVFANPRPKEPIEIMEIRNEIKLISSKNKDRLDKVICKIGSLKMANGYKPVYDELLNIAYGKMSNKLKAGNGY